MRHDYQSKMVTLFVGVYHWPLVHVKLTWEYMGFPLQGKILGVVGWYRPVEKFLRLDVPDATTHRWGTGPNAANFYLIPGCAHEETELLLQIVDQIGPPYGPKVPLSATVTE